MAAREIDRLAARQQSTLVARDERMLGELGRRYGESYQQINADVANLLKKVEQARQGGGEIRPSWLLENKRLMLIQRQVVDKLERFNGTASTIISRGQMAGLLAGDGDSQALIRHVGAVGVDFAALPERAFEQIVGRTMHDGRPLAQTLARLPGDGAAKVRSRLIKGVALGQGPEQIARLLRADLGGNLGQYMTIARTEVMGAYRAGAIERYRESEDILEGWEWWTADDEKTCAWCLDHHGNVYPLDEEMESHPNCRCRALPKLKER